MIMLLIEYYYHFGFAALIAIIIRTLKRFGRNMANKKAWITYLYFIIKRLLAYFSSKCPSVDSGLPYLHPEIFASKSLQLLHLLNTLVIFENLIRPKNCH